jgi:hypothetical protein
MSAERAVLVSVRVHESVHGEVKSFGRKRINTSGLVSTTRIISSGSR